MTRRAPLDCERGRMPSRSGGGVCYVAECSREADGVGRYPTGSGTCCGSQPMAGAMSRAIVSSMAAL